MLSTGVLFASVIAAILPTVFFVTVIYWVDHYEKEPTGLLAATFVWGAIPSIVAALLLNALFSLPPALLLGPQAAELFGASIVAPVVEESLKGAALIWILLRRRHELDSLLDGIIYGAMVGLGFAMVENVFYYLNTYTQGGSQAWGANVFLRGIVFGLNHALFSSLAGLGVAASRLSKRRAVQATAPLLGWLAAVTVHLVHNLTAWLGGVLCLVTLFNAWGGVLLVALIVIWALWQERRWLQSYLAEEVAAGTITRTQYELALSPWRRSLHLIDLLLTQGLQHYRMANHFFRRCSELAYKKHHVASLREAPSEQLVAELRHELAQISRSL